MTTKKHLGPVPLIYPVPIALVGVLVDGKPNVTEVGDVGIMASNHPMCTSRWERNPFQIGTTQTGQFSLNFPIPL